MNNLRKGLMAATLSMALFAGGAAIGAAAQSASPQYHATPQSSPPAVENPGSPSAAPQSAPAATVPDQDNGVRQAPAKHDRDAKAQDRDKDRDAMAAGSAREANDLTEQEIKTWDSFLDSHPQIAEA